MGTTSQSNLGSACFDDLYQWNYWQVGGLVIYHQASRRSFFLGKPKGVLLSHANLMAQMEAMEEAWAWTCDDLIYHPLPLHHIHVREISVMLILLPLGNC